MKWIMFDWVCDTCGEEYSDLAKPDTHQQMHDLCGGMAKRILSAPHFDIRMGVDPTGNPTMARKWARQHEQSRKIEEKRAREHGPNAWGSNGADIRR
jgi:hypothetical protein